MLKVLSTLLTLWAVGVLISPPLTTSQYCRCLEGSTLLLMFALADSEAVGAAQ